MGIRSLRSVSECVF